MNELQTTNPFATAVVAEAPSGMLSVEVNRAQQEIQAAIFLAKKFPRDRVAAYDGLMQTCKRRSFAERGLYAYPRGGQTITGASIRLAEAAAQQWGNVRVGVVEIESTEDTTTGEAFAWDLETNFKVSKTFTVRHERMAGKKVTKLTDPRDIYEMFANYGARRLRACIESVIPKDVMDDAKAQCLATVNNQSAGVPLIDRIRKMVVAFAGLSVTQGMLEQRLAHKVDISTLEEIQSLEVVYLSLRSGEGRREDYFTVDPVATGPAADLNARFAPKPVEDEKSAT